LSGRLASRLGIACYRGAPVAAACATGLYSVLDAADMMEHQQCISALAGAADTGLTPMLHAGFRSLKVLCGESLPQAFAQATGFAPALGAGFLALDREGPWILRGGIRYGDAGHQTRYTDPRTLRGALEALWSILPEPNLICTHGTGTVTGDAYERAALDQGPWARVERIHCKPFIGHCLGASGTAELALALEAPVRRLWKLSLGFGGHLAAVAAERS
jgi:3-oxoacyl-(acyl-carrier-protein) synthase